MYRGFLLFVFYSLFSFSSFASVDVSKGFADLAERLVPAVVNISTEHVAKEPVKRKGIYKFFSPSSAGGSLFDEFKEFFDKMEPFMSRPENSERDYISLGSGFIINEEGLIVTNSHVILDAKEVTVTLSNNIQYKAIVLGQDDKTDLAVVKIDTKGKALPFVKFGNSDNVRVGDWVLAIGNPFGLGGSVSAGIVSARARDINLGGINEFIQTDAAINRGNSGGPLFNSLGEVIGINTAIFSPSGGNIGIGFAIPSNAVKNIVDILAKGQKIKHGWIGVKIQGMTPEIAQSLKLESTTGALVAEVSKGGPAEKAGLKVGDVILSFGGEKVTSVSKLPAMVSKTKIDKYVDLEIFRKGKSITKALKIGELQEASDISDAEGPTFSTEALGISVSGRDSTDVKGGCEGVVITDMDARSDLALKGVRAGDIISAINQNVVDSVAKFRREFKKVLNSDAKNVLLLVCRGNETIFIAVKLNR